MSRDAGKDFSASPETEQLLSTDTCRDASETSVSSQRWSTDESYLQGDASSLRSTPQDKSVQIGETSSNPGAVITLSINNGDNDDPPPYTAIPPPYSAIAPPNHAGWPYELFSFGNTHSMDQTNCRVQIPLTSFQASLTPATGFHSQGTNGQHALMPLTPERFFKMGCRRSSFESTSCADDRITEKSNDKKSRRYGAILVAAAVIIFLMVLSLMVRFVMERSWWRR